MEPNLPTELYWMTMTVAMTAIFYASYIVCNRENASACNSY